MNYLSLEEVLAIHRTVMEAGGVAYGVRDWHGLISALEQPKQQAFNQHLYPTLASKAAILLMIMIQYHPFLDGNKRTAYFSMLRFINKNGKELNISDDDAVELVIKVATGELKKEELETKLQDSINSIN